MPSTPHKPPFERVFLMLAGAVILVFSVAVLSGIWLVRSEIRHQVLKRDGILLTNVAQHLYEAGSDPMVVEWNLLELALDSSKIKGIIAVRVFHPLNELVEKVPDELYSVSLAEEDQAVLTSGNPVIRYFSDFPLDTLFSDIEELDFLETAPLVEIIAPLIAPTGEVNASIQYWLDGAEVASELRRLDNYLALMAFLFLGGGGIIFSIVFMYARKRLIGMADLLSQRNEALRKANADLAMAARTSAIGSITGHLFHGLKNPLAGLKTYLKVTSQDEEAIAIADRMQSLINETLSVIREDSRDLETEISMTELEDLARKRLLPGSPQVQLKMQASGTLAARQAQLLLLILRNLCDNAVEASEAESPVVVNIRETEDALQATVSDSGGGLPNHVKDRLFEPVTSSKAHGTGIGLAISAVLARHIPADLELVRSDAHGTEFSITIPR